MRDGGAVLRCGDLVRERTGGRAGGRPGTAGIGRDGRRGAGACPSDRAGDRLPGSGEQATRRAAHHRVRREDRRARRPEPSAWRPNPPSRWPAHARRWPTRRLRQPILRARWRNHRRRNRPPAPPAGIARTGPRVRAAGPSPEGPSTAAPAGGCAPPPWSGGAPQDHGVPAGSAVVSGRMASAASARRCRHHWRRPPEPGGPATGAGPRRPDPPRRNRVPVATVAQPSSVRRAARPEIWTRSTRPVAGFRWNRPPGSRRPVAGSRRSQDRSA